MQWSIDVSGPVSALGSLRSKLLAGIPGVLEEQANTIQNRARTVHRYIRRTGNLQQATVAEATKTEITGYLDESVAHYGKYVHDGQRSWAPDPFLDNAFAGSEGQITRAVEQAIDSAITNAGLA